MDFLTEGEEEDDGMRREENHVQRGKSDGLFILCDLSIEWDTG